MSGESARSDNSEKKKNNSNNKPSKSVPRAEHELLKEKYETLTREHETLFTTLEKKQREAVMAKGEVEKWEKKFGELQMKLEKVEKDIEDLKSFDETEMNGVDSGVIVISDDDEGNHSGSSRGHSNKEYYFSL